VQNAPAAISLTTVAIFWLRTLPAGPLAAIARFSTTIAAF
jgi:hypothetical protein